jgi:ATP phosphoribosyltransferase
MTIVSNARMIANKFPQTTSEVRQINDLVAQIQGKIKQNQPQQEPAAPPV